MSWGGFALVFAAFFLTHSVPVRPAIKSRIVGKVGAIGFGVGYSALSLAMLSLLIWSAGHAPFVELWPQSSWQRHVTHLGMLAVCLILGFAIGRPNPFSFGGARNEQFDPDRPGIVGWVRHPILLALAFWAAAHLVPNGDLAHVILFGVLGAFAVAGRSLIDRRKRRVLGAKNWAGLDKARRTGPKVYRPRSWSGFGLRAVMAVGAFAVLLWMHPYVIGVSAL